jgi:hypothetical protein
MPPRVAPPEPQLDHSSPFYVHPGDGPSSVTVTPLLTGSNYHSWSLSMKRALNPLLNPSFSLKMQLTFGTSFVSVFLKVI